MSRNILVIENRLDYKAIYGLNFNVYLGARIAILDNLPEIETFLSANSVDVVFADNRGFELDMAHQVQKKYSDKLGDAQFYIVGETECNPAKSLIFPKTTDLKQLIKSIATFFGVTAKEMASAEVPEMYPLPTQFLIAGWMAGCDVFKYESDEYQILIEERGIITRDKLNGLKELEHNECYVKKEDRIKFVSSITSLMVTRLKDKNLTVDEKIMETSKAFEMVVAQAKEVGVSETTLQVADASINAMQDTIKSIPSLDKMLDKLLSDEKSYRYKKCLLSSYIGTHIVDKMQWGTVEQRDKLSFVCFFCDITIPKDEWCKLQTDDEVDALDIGKKEKQIIKSHAILSAKMVAENNKVPLGADILIKQHHGCKQGNSLSNLSLGISPLAIVHILAQEWAHIVLEYGNGPKKLNKKKVLEHIRKKYDIPAYRKILPVLESLEI